MQHYQTQERIQQRIREFLGSTILELLSSDDVTEVLVNEDGTIWSDGYSGMQSCGTISHEHVRCLIEAVASSLNQVVGDAYPSLSAELYLQNTQGEVKRHRFQAQMPPVVSSPSFAIRKPAGKIYTLEDYLDSGMLSESHYASIADSIENRRNIMVVGGTGTGKTTLTNAILAKMALAFPDERMIVIEDTQELQCAVSNRLMMRSCESRPISALIRDSLRLRPDRIIVGEVRGAEAHWMLKAWNTGHEGGLCTVHANDALSGLRRLEQLVQEANVPPNPQVIAETIHTVIWIARDANNPKGRRVRQVLNVKGYNAGESRYIVEKG